MAQKSIRSFFTAAPPAQKKESQDKPASKKKAGVIDSDSEDDSDSKENIPNLQNESSNGRASTSEATKDPSVPDSQGADPKAYPQLRKTARKSFKRNTDPDPHPLQADNKRAKLEAAASMASAETTSRQYSAKEERSSDVDDDSSRESPVKVFRKKKSTVIDSDSENEMEKSDSQDEKATKKSLTPVKEKSPVAKKEEKLPLKKDKKLPVKKEKSPVVKEEKIKEAKKDSQSPVVSKSSPASSGKLASIFTKSVPPETASLSKTDSSPVKSPPTSGTKAEESATPKQPVKKNPFAAFMSPSGGGKKKEEAGGADYTARVKKSAYHPVDDCWWARGEKTPYLALANTLLAIEETQGRLKTIEILANYFRSVIVQTPQDLLPSIYLTLNRLAPAWEGLELGIGDAMLIKALANSTGRTAAQIRADVAKTGDLGTVAETSKGSQRTMFQPASLTVAGVFTKLKEIATMTGQASSTKKVEKIQALLVACRGSEARYLIRSLAGKLRIGLAEQSVLQALAHASVQTPLGQAYPPPIHTAFKSVENNDTFKEKLASQALKLKTAYCECPTYDILVPALLEVGIDGLPQRCRLTPGIPLKPMLAFPTKGVQEVLTRFEGCKFTCEWKYDGERAQIHLLENGKILIFSRNQENNTTKYPDVISRFPACVKEGVKSAVIDSEAVAWDRENKVIQPFQVLSTRKRKDVAEADVKVQVCLFGFDLLYLNGESLVTRPFQERRALLREHFNEVEGEFSYAKGVDGSTTEEIQEALEESIKDNCEGLMVKTLDHEATYEIARRSHNWLKLKKDYLEGVGDTLDLVVIGGYLGKGKRVGGYGGFLLACYEPDNEEYQSICKIGTGFSDEDFAKHHAFFKDHVIDKPKSYYSYDSAHTPDHWFEPVQVWEVKCADLSISPVHKAARGIVDPVKGVSLRFPRFIRIRDDKTAEDATNAEQIAEMYRNQDIVKNQQNGTKTSNIDDDFDF